VTSKVAQGSPKQSIQFHSIKTEMHMENDKICFKNIMIAYFRKAVDCADLNLHVVNVGSFCGNFSILLTISQ